jgi:hypothetical protein
MSDTIQDTDEFARSIGRCITGFMRIGDVIKLIESRDAAIRADEARKQEQRFVVGVTALNKPQALADLEATK